MFRARQPFPAPQLSAKPLCMAFTLALSGRYLLPALSILFFRSTTALSARVHINIIPKALALLCFHTLTDSFARRKTLSPVVSISSTLFVQNTGGGVSPSILALLFYAHVLRPTHEHLATPIPSWVYFTLLCTPRGVGRLGNRGTRPSRASYPAIGADAGVLSICVKASCPQAAITSRPREYRVNTGTPRSSRIL